MYEISLEEFEAIVDEALRTLPDAFRDQIANLDVRVEEWAQPEDYGRTATPAGSTLLGVYRGIPLTKRGVWYNMALPDRIAIFRQPLQHIARDETDLRQRIVHVVRHEIAHYFGISDERLREIDAY